MKPLADARAYALAFGLLATPAFAGPPSGSTEIEGQKVLTLVVREPPVLRCNNNMQVAAELSNLYKVPILVLPANLASWSKAPAVYYGEQLIAEDGGDFNGMVSFDQMRDVIEIEVPADIVALRRDDPAAAAQWRIAVREALLAAFAQGFVIIGVGIDGGYVLERRA